MLTLDNIQLYFPLFLNEIATSITIFIFMIEYWSLGPNNSFDIMNEYLSQGIILELIILNQILNFHWFWWEIIKLVPLFVYFFISWMHNATKFFRLILLHWYLRWNWSCENILISSTILPNKFHRLQSNSKFPRNFHLYFYQFMSAKEFWINCIVC